MLVGETIHADPFYRVMDVKAGSGAFMSTMARSRELAKNIETVGNGAGVKTSALITDMNPAAKGSKRGQRHLYSE